MRISPNEIVGAIELFVNAIYDEPNESGWQEATLEEWKQAVYEELTTWKTVNGCSWYSSENRFDGKSKIMKTIEPWIVERLERLKKEGYEIKAI